MSALIRSLSTRLGGSEEERRRRALERSSLAGAAAPLSPHDHAHDLDGHDAPLRKPASAGAVAASAAATAAVPPSLPLSPPTSPDPLLSPTLSASSARAPAPSCGRRATNLALTLLCVGGYGVSLYVNGLSGRALSPALGLVLLGTVRGLALLAFAAALYATKSVPPELLPGGAGKTFSWRMLAPAFVGVFANSGFMPYAALVQGGQVSVLAPMVGVYSIVPIAFGLVFMKEARGWPKLLGIALSLTSVLLLAFSGAGFGANGAGADVVAEKALLFLAVIACWGGGDCIAAYLGRTLSTFEISCSNCVGQLATAALYGLVAIASNQLGDGGGRGSGDVGALSFLAASALANVCGIAAWIAFTKLGESEGASDFTPLVALYVYVPVVLSALLLGESVFSSALKVVGIVLAGVAAFLLSWRVET